jgi:hypothetical protein
MIFGLFILAVALSISVVAAYYSIAGLAAIFAAAVVPVVVMGAVLEVGKIAATVWLHKFWHQANIKFKLYLIPAILILMIVTSMGIFGFLSKAHMDQTLVSGDVVSQVQIIDEKILLERDNIETQRDNIAAAKAAIAQMDSQVNARLDRGTNERSAERAVQIRRNQAKERTLLQKEIQTAQKEIDVINARISALSEERIPFAAEVRKVEAEVGPIKYIAALIYGDNPDSDLLERAVRWVIILLVLVFDPMALILILAAEQTILWAREDKKKRQDWHQEWVPNSENPWHDDGPLTDDELEEIKVQSGIDQDLEMTETLFDTEEEFFAHGKEIARELDAQRDQLPNDYASTQAYLHNSWSWFKGDDVEGGWVPKQEPVEEDPLDIPVLENEEMWAQEVIDAVEHIEETPEQDDNDILESATSIEKEAMQRWKEEHPSSSLRTQRKLFERGDIDELPWNQYLSAQPDFLEESKKKDSDVDGDRKWSTNNKEQIVVSGTYVQNAEQGEETLWQRIKKGNV